MSHHLVKKRKDEEEKLVPIVFEKIGARLHEVVYCKTETIFEKDVRALTFLSWVLI